MNVGADIRPRRMEQCGVEKDRIAVALARLRGVYSDNLIEVTEWCMSLDPLSRPQSVFALHNVSAELQLIPMVELNLIATESWSDLISGQHYEDIGGVLELPPYGCVWITNKA